MIAAAAVGAVVAGALGGSVADRLDPYATIVRALLVPSLMELLGRRNWWSPRPLRPLWERVGLRESGATAGA